MPETPEQVVAANVRRLRKARGLSQERLTTRLKAGSGLATMSVWAIERGRRRVTVNDLVALADALGTTAADLMSPDPDDATAPVRRVYNVALDNGTVQAVTCDQSEIDPNGWLCLYNDRELAFTAPGARVVSVLDADKGAERGA
ncbi:helix-turn-helix domain-containing protein [Streptomyces sp. NPDC091292]|uniref:helix-turn-helix domain-containing protein n=1 Tax=Streptomyces sp. NPDC091292 TaxID=3365991 RepID=UPI00381EE0CA